MEAKNLKGSRLDNWSRLSFKLGVWISLTLIIIGLILSGITGAKDVEPIAPLNQLLRGILELDASAIITLGLLLLLVTPVIQVIVAIVTFSIAKDKLYLGICITLLCVLSASFVLALI